MGAKLLWSPLKHNQMEMASTQRCTFLLIAGEPKSEKKEAFLGTNSLYILTSINWCKHKKFAEVSSQVSFPSDVILGHRSSCFLDCHNTEKLSSDATS